ncbi:phosphatidylinositol-4-phosphate 3-kinase catalytic subunit Pi3K68D isoform X1 [Tachypleus tridentatus]|uniref:phosphatidylinositol-4-phosphate 3-kinase catalytic subunit Pi3K68D isoform X1 n=2 Tax=Tachypleus tridentatus TaxID=6853 RepID=UPI003FCEF5D6
MAESSYTARVPDVVPVVPPRLKDKRISDGTKHSWPVNILENTKPVENFDKNEQNGSSEYGAASPPPLPPRRLAPSSSRVYPSDVDELMLVPPPPPPQTQQSSDIEDLILFSSTENEEKTNRMSHKNIFMKDLLEPESNDNLTSHCLSNQISAYIEPIRREHFTDISSKFQTNPQYMWPNMSTFFSQRPSIQLPQILEYSFSGVQRLANSPFTLYNIQHSNSSPELANVCRNAEDSHLSVLTENTNIQLNRNYPKGNSDCVINSKTHHTSAESVLTSSEQKKSSNLIDLLGVDVETSINQKSCQSTVDDILSMFDPLIAENNNQTKPKDFQIAQENERQVFMDFHLRDQIEGCSEKDNFDFLSSTDGIICQVEEKIKFFPTLKSNAITSDKAVEKIDIKNTTESTTGSYIKIVKRCDVCDTELNQFCDELKQLRSEFPSDDHNTNEGLVISATLENKQYNSYSIKLEISSEYSVRPITFTCDTGTSIEHIISHVVCSTFDDLKDINMDDFILKVRGLTEYLTCDSSLGEYEYVHYCQKCDQPVCLRLIHVKDLKHPLARTLQDDIESLEIKPTDLMSPKLSPAVNFEAVKIVMETLKKEVEKLKIHARNDQEDTLQPLGVIQALKALCTLLSHIETVEISDSLQNLKEICETFGKSEFCQSNIFSQDKSVNEHTNDNITSNQKDNTLLRLDLVINQLYEAVYQLLVMYCQAYEVDFTLHFSSDLDKKLSSKMDVTSILDTLLVHVGPVFRILPHWASSFDHFYVSCVLCHGSQEIASVTTYKPIPVKKSFFDRIVFDDWLHFQTVCLCTLPREAKLYFTLIGVPAVPAESKQTEAAHKEKIMIGWCGMNLFNFKGELCQGNYLLGLWSNEIKKEMGPAVCNPSSNCPVLQIGLTEFEGTVVFPDVIQGDISVTYKKDIEQLDFLTRKQLLEIVQKDHLTGISQEEKELLWANRHCMYGIPEALPKILQSAHGWDWACLSDIYFLLQEWCPLPPIDALVLLLRHFPDHKVRYTAVQWIKNVGCDELCDYLPQLVQALRFETWDSSPLAWFLLERSLTSVRVTHHLYWLLKQNINDPLAGRRMCLMLNALLTISGKAMRDLIKSQESLLQSLSDIADRIKNTKDSLRLSTMLQGLESIHHNLLENPTVLPLSPSLQVHGVDIKCCSYFTSNTLPLKLIFKSSEEGTKPIEAIYKVGDDLRQDMLTIQMIRIMDKLWLKEGLDLKIITFTCIPTEVKKGIVEMVTEAETLRKIQTEHGLTGSFKDRPIAEWLQKHNASELEYQHAVENFSLSCAGYCVATYILGICDRHNDNIMLKTSGHMFHIDFGKFLGDAQTFGNIKRDRTPFILTSDMVYVINGGDKPSEKFQNFIDICCQAFNIIRQHRSILLTLFSLMAASDIPGVTESAVHYVQKALLPHLSEAEATAHFTRMIEDSLKSWFTQFNFFIHNLAQLRFTGDHNDELLLSFSPKTFTKETDGCIKCLKVVSYQKRYDPEKYYVYEIKVTRENVNQSMTVFRTYREFWEFHQKLCMMFPLAKFHPLPRGSFVGRSNIREVAEQRMIEIDNFLKELLDMADEVAHCSLVYTFFHPLLRDQEGSSQNAALRGTNTVTRRRESGGRIKGQVKLSVEYKNNSLFVMVMHAKNLRSLRNSAPDSYVKMYLIPDPHKLTKRKTKVIWKNTHPTFMEMLVYGLPIDVVKSRTLHLSVWNFDRVQENEFLGSTLIPLKELNLLKENVRWYPLGSFPL